MGWASVEVPRLVRYEQASKASGSRSTKQSMTQTFIARYLEAGGKLLPNTWVRSLSRHGGRWQVQVESVNYPAISGCPVLTCEADVARLPATIPANRANLSTLHLFSSCRMGEKRHGCTADSFGKVYGADQLYIVDASLLCGPTTVNPQGTVMAIAHRNIVEFLSL